MRIAALYDIHGNVDALEAVLADAARAGAEQVLLGGDVVMGPFPAEVMARLRRLPRECEALRGNTDRVVAAPTIDESDPWKDRIAWVAGRLSPAERAWLAKLPTTISLVVDGLGPTLFYHGTPRSDSEIITRLTPEERLREVFADVAEDVVLGGHVHVQDDRRAAGKRVVNAGSVGAPYEDAPGAYWALLGAPGVPLELRHTRYDVARAAERVLASGMPGAADFAKNMLTPMSPESASARFERMAEEARA
jgi:predicted phosphodiesterase